MEATMKKKIDANEDDTTDRLEKQKKKPQSDYMKQLTDLAQQVTEQTPPPSQPEPPIDDTKQSVNLILFVFISIIVFCLKETGVPPGSSRAASRLARETPLRRPPPPKLVPPSKPARIPVKQIPVVITESTQTVEIRAKTPRQFSSSFSRFINTLKELNWFEEQYPSIKIDVCCFLFF